MGEKISLKSFLSNLKENFWIDMAFIAGGALVGLVLKYLVEHNTLAKMFEAFL